MLRLAVRAWETERLITHWILISDKLLLGTRLYDVTL